jgi:hypothetical protein
MQMTRGMYDRSAIGANDDFSGGRSKSLSDLLCLLVCDEFCLTCERIELKDITHLYRCY